MSTPRKDVPTDNRWDVESFYSSFEAWEKEFAAVTGDATAAQKGEPRWPTLAVLQGTLEEGPSKLKEALNLIHNTARDLEKLYTYAHLRHDEEITLDKYKVAYNKIRSAFMEFSQEIAWFEPELLSLPQETIDAYLNSPELQEYRFHIQKIVHVKEHVLTAEKEQLLALAGNALSASQKAFSAINDADFKFGTALDSEGKAHNITHASYGMIMRGEDRTLRENAFHQLHGKFGAYSNTLTELLNGQVQAHLFDARAHNYKSCLQSALFPKNIDVKVYHSLIQAVRNKLPLVHKYMKLRKQLLNVEKLHFWDMYVPLVDKVDMGMEYKAGEEAVIASVAPLGEEYQEILRRGLTEERWVDRYENDNKRSGAYSSGCYDSHPYILMNYKGILRDVFTLAHEAGHSVHSYLSRKHQPYHESNYSIFIAEVASTFNEELLMRHLLKKTTDARERAFLINEKIEDLRGTLIRQTMFAEFELIIHELAEKGTPLTPDGLRKLYGQLSRDYFGPDVVIDEEIHHEWSRIPHFYYNFYVYQYATGISAAMTLAKKVIEGGDSEREAYLSFLKGGCSKYPIDLLCDAGVDLRTPQPVETALERFGQLVDELEQSLAVN